MRDSIEGFLEDFNAGAQPLYKNMCHAFWRGALSGTKEDEERAAAAETRFRTLYSSSDGLARLKYARSRLSGAGKPASAGATASAGVPEDDLALREVTVLIQEFTSNQMPPELLEETIRRQKSIETTFNTFRAVAGDRRLTANEVAQVLKTSGSSEERRAVWEASKEIGAQTAGPLLELARLRNKIARDLGYPDFYRMSLELQELTSPELEGICSRFETVSNEPFRGLRQEMDAALASRFALSPDQLRPWHYSDPFFQEAPKLNDVDLDPIFAREDLTRLAGAFYRGIGLPVEDVLARSDLYEREGKDQHAFCIHMDRAGDVRILCNLRPTSRWMGTLLHECGHAVYDTHLDGTLPFTLRLPAHTFATEAIANLMGRQAKEVGWLRAAFGPALLEGLGAGALTELEQSSRGLLRSQMLVTTRWMLVMIHFERELYADPDQDLNRLWWDLVERYQFLRRPENRDRPDWASKIHLACFPVYYHNYLLGEFMASQLRRHIDRHVLGSGADTLAGSVDAGAYLKREIFTPGARYRWDELLRRATGETLNPEHFVEQFV